MNNYKLEKIINEKLKTCLEDYVPNGLQIEGKKEIKKIITGVTACQKLLDISVKEKADAVIVHHGYFWKNNSLIIDGIQRKRIKTILMNNINLYSWHIPLDVNKELGNNVVLANNIGIKILGYINDFVPYGKLQYDITGTQFLHLLKNKISKNIIYSSDNAPKKIKMISFCTGAGQKFIELSAKFGVDAFITGEISEQTVHFAREYGIHFYALGHHATEKGGIQALGDWLSKKYKLFIKFYDVYNPA